MEVCGQVLRRLSPAATALRRVLTGSSNPEAARPPGRRAYSAGPKESTEGDDTGTDVVTAVVDGAFAVAVCLLFHKILPNESLTES